MNAPAPAARPTCFVMMPFSDPDGYDPGHFERVYKHLIARACDQAGLQPVHLLEARSASLITADIVRLVTEAPMAVCDLSSRNPNVMFELGLRQAARKPVVLIKDDVTGKIFDVDALRTIAYQRSLRADLVEAAIDEIAAAMRQSLADHDAGRLVYLVDLASAAFVNQRAAESADLLARQIDELKASMAQIHKHLLGTAKSRPASRRRNAPAASGVAANPRIDGIGPLIARKLWPVGATLKVLLMKGSKTMQQKARAAARTWSQYANINFEFVTSGDADIRVSFEANDGNWSFIGTDAKDVPAGSPTMNLAFDTESGALKEFGHALGLVQEHQNPDNGMRWNRAAVLAEFKGAPNFWDDATIEHNILRPYDQKDLGNYRELDPESVMMHSFPAAWTLDGRGSRGGTQLSASDKALIARLYPGRGAP